MRAAFLLSLAGGAWLAAQAAPAIHVGPLTAPDHAGPFEVAVAINPTVPTHAIAVMASPGAPGQARVVNYGYTSLDGGRTWKGAPAANPGALSSQGDDVVTFGPDGTAYHAYIAYDGIRTARADRAASGIHLRTSRDGVTWTDAVAVVDHVNSAIPFEDKPWVGVDRSPGSPHRGNVYVAWTRFDVYGSDKPEHRSHIMVARSRDGGRNFSVPLDISDVTGDAKDSDDTVEGAVPAVGPNGEVYIAWAGPKGIVIDKSTDGGWTFATDVQVSPIVGGWDSPVEGLERHNGMPVTGVDVSPGQARGSVYVNWIDTRNGDPDVFVSASRDGGRTWEAPVRVNDDPKGAVQMFTWMAVDPVDGSINVVFHDRRGQAGTKTGVTLARSIDGGRTFRNVPLAVPAFDCCGPGFFGDYNGIDAYGGRVVAAFPVVTADGNRIWAASARFKVGTTDLQ